MSYLFLVIAYSICARGGRYAGVFFGKRPHDGIEAHGLSGPSYEKAAAADIDAVSLTRLSAPAFEELCLMLDDPLPESTRELLARKEIWV